MTPAEYGQGSNASVPQNEASYARSPYYDQLRRDLLNRISLGKGCYVEPESTRLLQINTHTGFDVYNGGCIVTQDRNDGLRLRFFGRGDKPDTQFGTFISADYKRLYRQRTTQNQKDSILFHYSAWYQNGLAYQDTEDPTPAPATWVYPDGSAELLVDTTGTTRSTNGSGLVASYRPVLLGLREIPTAKGHSWTVRPLATGRENEKDTVTALDYSPYGFPPEHPSKRMFRLHRYRWEEGPMSYQDIEADSSL